MRIPFIAWRRTPTRDECDRGSYSRVVNKTSVLKQSGLAQGIAKPHAMSSSTFGDSLDRYIPRGKKVGSSPKASRSASASASARESATVAAESPAALPTALGIIAVLVGGLLLSFVVGLSWYLLFSKKPHQHSPSPDASPSSAPSTSPCGDSGCNTAAQKRAPIVAASEPASFASMNGTGAYAASSTQSREDALKAPAGRGGRAPRSQVGTASGDPVAGSLGFASGKASGNVDMNTLNPASGHALPSGPSGASPVANENKAKGGNDPASFIAANSGVAVIALFYANWCGHCKTFKPIFEDAASQYNGDAKFITIDGDQHSEFCQSIGVRGFPTVIKFEKGQNVRYQGQRTVAALLDFAK